MKLSRIKFFVSNVFSAQGIFIIFVFTAMTIIFSCSSFLEREEMNLHQVEKIFLRAIDQNDLPSLQYIVFDQNSFLYEFNGGKADIKNNLRVNTETRFKLYSMTKTFTAAAILLLAQRNEIALDDPVAKYIDKIPYGKSVTIKHLLSHTSGIPNPIPLKWIHTNDELWTMEKEDSALKKLMNENPELDFKPGAKYQYSNIGYWLLGKIIERVSGKSYSKFIEENIFSPLKIRREELGFDNDNLAKGYLAKWSFMNLIKSFLVDDEIIGKYENNWLHIKPHQVNGLAFGGLNGTARGVAKFLQDQFMENSILFDCTFHNLFFEEITTIDSCRTKMTLAWHIEAMNGVKYFFKEGGGGGFHSEMRIYPEQKIGSVIITNETGSYIKKLQNKVDDYFISNHK